MDKAVEQIFVELIQSELNLPDNYGVDANGNDIPCVTVKSQNIKLFNTPELQITIGTLSSDVFSNRKYFETNQDGSYQERIVINERRQMQIDIYSRNDDARLRFYEVQACLNSTKAQQLQEQYQFNIGTVSNVVNLSGLDGGSDINRYTIRFSCLTWQEKITKIDYYDKFKTTVEDEKGLITNFGNYTEQ